MLNSSSLWQELINDRRGFALCSPSVRIAIAQPCPASSSSSPVPSWPLSCSPVSGSPPPAPLQGRGRSPGTRGLKREPPEERCHLHPCYFQSNRGRGAPSLPPSPALTLALTSRLRENRVLVGGGIVSVSSKSADSLGCIYKQQSAPM